MCIRDRTEIDAVRRMPLAAFLARLGHEPVRRSGTELWYIAPYRGCLLYTSKNDLDRIMGLYGNMNERYWYCLLYTSRCV